MTASEKEIASRLQALSGKFANFKEGKFVDQLNNWHDKDMTEDGRNYMLRLLDRYQHLIPDAQELKEKHVDEQLGEI